MQTLDHFEPRKACARRELSFEVPLQPLRQFPRIRAEQPPPIGIADMRDET
jgi:hypothetical protein